MDYDRILIKVLSECGLLDREVDPVLYCSDSSHPIKTLARNGLLNEREAVTKVAERLRIEHLDLFDPAVLARCKIEQFVQRVSAELCSAHKMLPLYWDGDAIVVVFANPLDIEAQRQLKFALNGSIRACIAEEDSISAAIVKHFPSAMQILNEEYSEEGELDVVSTLASDESDLDEGAPSDAPVVRLINRLLIEGVRLRASDIHLDPTPNGLDIRYRIDGVLQHVYDTHKRLQRPVVSRLKLLSGMNIAEKRAPQDGRFRIKYEGRPIDLRVSCVPTAYGEKIVLRLLKSDFANLSFDNLGMPNGVKEQLCRDLSSPGRMVLVTGPTGSGKTTTLYTALRFLSDGSSNIETVEDPIEYKIPGVNQIQVNEAAGVTFSSSLRSILRQDPDIIMVGEIRDSETAGIALQAAQTGHLVLSSLHTNDAPSAITRLLSLGCDPFVLSSSLAGVLAQRLVRKVCRHCAEKGRASLGGPELEVVARYNLDAATLPYTKGCERCQYTGYYGRVGIYSYLHVTPHLATMIHGRATLSEIVEEARRSGFAEIGPIALTLVKDGVTSLAEVMPFLLVEPSQGARELPAVREQAAADWARETILLVEDDPQNRAAIAFHLRKNHFRVVEKESGLAALDGLRETAPSLVITGLGLPSLDGRQLLSRIRNDDERGYLPVVVLTSADSDENEAELLKLGADDFISRSRSPAVLVERVRKILARRS